MDKNEHSERDVNIGQSMGKDYDQPAIEPAVVRFDADCSLCRTLAGFMSARVASDVMVFKPNELGEPNKLTVEFYNHGIKNSVSGEDAWAWVLEHHPILNELNWLAQKLGISRGTTRMLMGGGDLLRRFCFRCRSK